MRSELPSPGTNRRAIRSGRFRPALEVTSPGKRAPWPGSCILGPLLALVLGAVPLARRGPSGRPGGGLQREPAAGASPSSPRKVRGGGGLRATLGGGGPVLLTPLAGSRGHAREGRGADRLGHHRGPSLSHGGVPIHHRRPCWSEATPGPGCPVTVAWTTRVDPGCTGGGRALARGCGLLGSSPARRVRSGRDGPPRRVPGRRIRRAVRSVRPRVARPGPGPVGPGTRDRRAAVAAPGPPERGHAPRKRGVPASRWRGPAGGQRPRGLRRGCGAPPARRGLCGVAHPGGVPPGRPRTGLRGTPAGRTSGRDLRRCRSMPRTRSPWWCTLTPPDAGDTGSAPCCARRGSSSTAGATGGPSPEAPRGQARPHTHRARRAGMSEPGDLGDNGGGRP